MVGVESGPGDGELGIAGTRLQALGRSGVGLLGLRRRSVALLRLRRRVVVIFGSRRSGLILLGLHLSERLLSCDSSCGFLGRCGPRAHSNTPNCWGKGSVGVCTAHRRPSPYLYKSRST